MGAASAGLYTTRRYTQVVVLKPDPYPELLCSGYTNTHTIGQDQSRRQRGFWRRTLDARA